jgi:hypothetical protein
VCIPGRSAASNLLDVDGCVTHLPEPDVLVPEDLVGQRSARHDAGALPGHQRSAVGASDSPLNKLPTALAEQVLESANLHQTDRQPSRAAPTQIRRSRLPSVANDRTFLWVFTVAKQCRLI